MSHSQRTIAEWLFERGMSEYAELFAKQKIDFSILPQLTEQDLKELGVALGDRRKFLGWFAELLEGGPIANNTGNNFSAERRQVTVLFCDLVDSTGLARRLDPEDTRDVIRAYQDAVTAIVRTYDGFVGGYRGDGVLICFGYPLAHEDDVERAVQAAIAIVAAVGEIEAAQPLQTRAGIATGRVVVGDLIGSGDTQERNMVGETPNLAARLLALAKPDSVVISDETRKMLGGFFELEDLGLRHVKGIDEPVRSWTVMNPRAVESRFDALHTAALTEFVGREDELQLLLKRWRKAKGGEGQVVLISGEPGIGKSRLTAALMDEIATGPHARLRYFCSPQHTDSAFYPVIGQLERAAGFIHGDSEDAKLAKLDKLLTSIAATTHDKALIAGLLSLATDRYPRLDYDAAQRRAKTLEALIAQVVSLAAPGPVLMILEDAHWIDPTTLESLGRMVERLKGLPILYLITYRPEFNAPWIGESHVTALHLNRLSDHDATRIVTSLAGNKALAAGVIENVIERSDGIPLFIEEMIKAVLEAADEDTAKRTIESAPSDKSAVPASLHASLMARLDRLGAARGVAQAGAAIGRSFTHQLIAAVARESDSELSQSLDRLVASGLLYRQGQPPQATYLFKHALVQDAAYSMLLREPRRALHGRILEALETNLPDIAEGQPELLAHHATEAAQIDKAAGYWGEAGKRAHHRSANLEAQAHLGRAQDQIAALARTSDTMKRQIELQVLLAQATSQKDGWSAPSTLAAYEQIGSLADEAEAFGDTPENSWPLFISLWGTWGAYLLAYQQRIERPLAQRLLSIAERSGDSYQLVIGHAELGKSLFFAGEFREALVHFDEAIAHYRPSEHRATLGPGTQDLGPDALMYKSWALNWLGYHDQARACAEKALCDAREAGHNFTIMYVLHGCLWNQLIWLMDLESAEDRIDELEQLANLHATAFWKANTLLQRGALLTETGAPEDGRRFIVQGIAAWRGMGATLATSHFQTLLALAEARTGRYEEAWRSIDEAISFMDTSGERYYGGYLFDMAGRIALMQTNPDTALAEDYFLRGIHFCRESGHPSSELRPSLHLARLWHDQGKSREAYDLLAPVYNWFTEGFDRPDLIEAKALLDELKNEL